ncbi:hypothetical protein SAY87_008830 [Trapa incisa]|uniref:Senescence regulator n=1 Tax=Trapa incisa TaxID=236973 RepID=A0AAN7PWT6_9MYRT|nr:hypothetical protein SAY87_008830 [Trapa incisa]
MTDGSSGSRRAGAGRNRQGQAAVEYRDLEEEEDARSAVKHRGGSQGGGGGGGRDCKRTSAALRAIQRPAEAAVTPRRPSSPVNIPDWSKIYGSGSGQFRKVEEEEEEDEEYEDGNIVPPHEWIARKLARTQISSSSMCEGVGRTLKGRDLSKVRNAILTKTGFLE